MTVYIIHCQASGQMKLHADYVKPTDYLPLYYLALLPAII
jgi:hypothetical protein